MLSRRDLVGRLAAGTAMVWAATGVARKSFASVRGNADGRPAPEPIEGRLPGPQTGLHVLDDGSHTTASVPAPWDLVRPLTLGAAVAHGWHVAGLTGIVDGSCVLTLQNERGRAHRVHICCNDGNPQGLVYTDRFDLVVMNGGQGDLATEESFAQAVAEVAHILEANEDEQPETTIGALLPHSERLRLFAGPMDRRLA